VIGLAPILRFRYVVKIMKLNRILLYTIGEVVFASVNVLAGGIQSSQAVILHAPVVNMPNISRALPVTLSNTIIIWDSDLKETNEASGASTANFIFNFTNVSANPITVLSVRTSCGCTTAQLPPLPWRIAPGTSGQIGVKVNLADKSGTLFKTINVNTDKGSKLLSVRINIPSSKINTLSSMPMPVIAGADRVHNVSVAQFDRQAVFHGDCASCHVKHGEGKFGKELFDADCGVCHEGEHRATMVPDLHTIPQTTNAEFWRTWISHGNGNPHSLMPAFAANEGGPLTDAQIASLIDYIATTIPPKSAGN
jgi:cytochrome c553